MTIIQISKIQQRSGNLVDLPQLDNAQFGFASDARLLFIGAPASTISGNVPENVEVLTAYSNIAFSQIAGSDGSNLNLSNIENGQVLAYNQSQNYWYNAGGNSGGLVNLGSSSNVKIFGGSSGYVLETDGLGNLGWTPKGAIVAFISNISQANPGIVTTTQDTPFTNGLPVTISDVEGMTQVNGGTFYVKVVDSNSFELYSDSLLSTTVNTLPYSTYTANGRAVASLSSGGSGTPGGSTGAVQFNNGGLFGGSGSLTFDGLSNLTLSGNFNVTNVYSSSYFSPNANITFEVSGQPNRFVISSTGANLTGTFSASGNAQVGNLSTTNISASTITASGNSSLQALTINGNLNITGANRAILADFSTSNLNNRTKFITSTTNGNTNISISPNGTGNYSSITAYNAQDISNSGFLAAAINSTTANIDVGINGSGTYLPLSINLSGTEAVRLTTTGNLGLGNSTPNAKLFVQGSSATPQILAFDGTVTQIVGAANSTTALSGTRSNHSYQLMSNDTSRVFIGATGLVGIGNSSPTDRLAVSGSIFVGGSLKGPGNAVSVEGELNLGRINSTTEGAQLNFNSANGNGRAYSIDVIGNTSNTLRFLDATNNNFATMSIAGSNVGIGTSSPSARLHVQTASSGIDGIIANNSNYLIRIHPRANAGDYNPIVQANDQTIIFSDKASPNSSGANMSIAPWSTSAIGMRFNTNGNVGINTSTPNAALHINRGAQNLALEGDTHTYMELYPRGYSAGRKGWLGFGAPGSNQLALSQEDTGILNLNNSGTQIWLDRVDTTGIAFITANVSRMQITNTLIATNIPIQAPSLVTSSITSLSGTLTVTPNVTSSAFYSTSDIRLKKDVTTIPNAMEKVSNLRGVQYKLKENDEPQIGLIAQEVEEVIPELVDSSQEMKTIDYGKMAGLFVEAIKELKQEINGLKQEIVELRKK